MKRKTDNFSKFYTKKNNAAIKESFRQEKKAAKKERKEAIERHFEEKRKARAAAQQAPAKSAGHGKPGNPAGGKPGNTVIAKPGNPVGAKPGKPIPVNPAAPNHPNEQLPLNKYIAHSGVCSRRDAAELIKQGKVTVNGQPITEPGTKVQPTDTVKVNGKKVTISRNFVYVLLNKPKDYITTTDDPQGRKTVLHLIKNATTERVFPVGRLDRNTSGVLLLTNDGDLAQKLAHPSHEIKKIYHVVLDKPLTKGDFDKIIGGGITLEDGPAHVDVIAYADPKDRTQIGLEIHSGRNRIVRRIFEHLGYDVRGLDRVMYAGLTKKNVQRGHWRLLTEKEIRILKYLNSSFKGSLAPHRAPIINVPESSAPRAEASKAFASKATAPKATGPADASKASAKKAPAPGSPPASAAASAATPAGTAKPKPARSIPPKGAKAAKPLKGRKPYNYKSPRPEKD